MAKTKPRYLTTAQAAELIGVGAAEVRYLIRMNQLRSIKYGRDYLIEPEDLKNIKYQRTPRARSIANELAKEFAKRIEEPEL